MQIAKVPRQVSGAILLCTKMRRGLGEALRFVEAVIGLLAEA